MSLHVIFSFPLSGPASEHQFSVEENETSYSGKIHHHHRRHTHSHDTLCHTHTKNSEYSSCPNSVCKICHMSRLYPGAHCVLGSSSLSLLSQITNYNLLLIGLMFKTVWPKWCCQYNIEQVLLSSLILWPLNAISVSGMEGHNSQQWSWWTAENERNDNHTCFNSDVSSRLEQIHSYQFILEWQIFMMNISDLSVSWRHKVKQNIVGNMQSKICLLPRAARKMCLHGNVAVRFFIVIADTVCLDTTRRTGLWFGWTSFFLSFFLYIRAQSSSLPSGWVGHLSVSAQGSGVRQRFSSLALIARQHGQQGETHFRHTAVTLCSHKAVLVRSSCHLLEGRGKAAVWKVPAPPCLSSDAAWPS